jgi:hypothetical protein
MHHSHPWRTLEGIAEDLMVDEVPPAWFLEQIEEAAE